MPDHLSAKRQIADIVLADLVWELFRFFAGEEARGFGKSIVDQRRIDAVIGDDEKPGILAGTCDGARQRRQRAWLAGEKWADIENWNAIGCGAGGAEQSDVVNGILPRNAPRLQRSERPAKR